ncbi:MAG: alpha/beta hydrolase [Verrucomicrobiae bacterium]|nr:alpha/beta hydrolase [Verrucomicrobiae bacterium]
MIRRRFLLLLAAIAVSQSSCVAPIRVKVVDPPPPDHRISDTALEGYRKLSAKDPLAAAGRLLDGIRACQNRVAKGEPGAVGDYNYLVARFVTQLERAGVEPWGANYELRGNSTVYQLTGRDPSGFGIGDRELLPTDRLEFAGKYSVPERILKNGVGAPVVSADRTKVDYIHMREGMEARYRAATALVRIDGTRATLELLDPFAVERVSFAGKTRTVAMDYSSTVSLAVSRDRVDKLGFARALNPQRYAGTARLTFAQPYDPQRIPVLLVHGLNDTPATWLPMYLGLIQDPEIRDRYQFWVFSYPSGYPFPYSAGLLRKELDRVNAAHPDHKDIVIVGHSMGGMISRMMVCDSEDTIWRGMFGKPPAETKITGSSRKLLEEALLFNARSEIDRAIFICAPHRGSDLATNWIGRLGSRLVRAPQLISDVTTTAINLVTVDPAGLQLQRAPNSIDTLAPNNRMVRATAALHIRDSIPYHSIMGDRGKGDTPDSSDGVVAYWSSHLDGAVSEKVVPYHHSSHQHPDAIAEVRRILKMHAAGR